MIAKPGGSCWKKKIPSNSLGPSRIPETIASPKNCCSEAWVSGIRILAGSPHRFVLRGGPICLAPVTHTPPKKLPHDLIGTNKQTWLKSSMYFLWNNNWWVGPWIYLLVKYRRGYHESFRVHQTWPLVCFAAHDHWSINGKHGSSYGAIDGSSLDGEFLIDRLCSAFPSEWNILHIYI